MLHIFFSFINFSWFFMNFKNLYFISLIITFFHLGFYQIKNLEVSNPNMCLVKFKSNNLLGLIVFINILIGKII